MWLRELESSRLTARPFWKLSTGLQSLGRGIRFVSERENQRGDGEIGTCHVCGRIFSTQEELSKHLMDDHDGEILGKED